MPFGRKEDLRESVKEMFGMEPEEVKKRLEKIDGMETTVNGIKTISEGTTSKLTEISEAIGKISTPYSSQERHETTTTTTNTPKEPARWDEDAEQAWKDRSTPLVAGLLDTRAMIAKREAQDTITAKIASSPNSVSWALLSDEINSKAEKCSLEQKANPLFWQNLYYLCLGEKNDEIARDRAAKKGKFYTETGSSSIVVDPEADQKPEDKLNASQLNAAKKAGLSPAQYAKELSSMQVWN